MRCRCVRKVAQTNIDPAAWLIQWITCWVVPWPGSLAIEEAEVSPPPDKSLWIIIFWWLFSRFSRSRIDTVRRIRSTRLRRGLSLCSLPDDTVAIAWLFRPLSRSASFTFMEGSISTRSVINSSNPWLSFFRRSCSAALLAFWTTHVSILLLRRFFQVSDGRGSRLPLFR